MHHHIYLQTIVMSNSACQGFDPYIYIYTYNRYIHIHIYTYIYYIYIHFYVIPSSNDTKPPKGHFGIYWISWRFPFLWSFTLKVGLSWKSQTSANRATLAQVGARPFGWVGSDSEREPAAGGVWDLGDSTQRFVSGIFLLKSGGWTKI